MINNHSLIMAKSSYKRQCDKYKKLKIRKIVNRMKYQNRN